jgi:phosphoribosylanthranilate isomerase
MRVKICGVRRVEDAQLACELGADAIGLVFWPDSPRFIDPYRARAIVAALPPFVSPVGVFVDQPSDYVSGVAGLVRLGAVQLHGNEPAATYAKSVHRVIKAVTLPNGVESLAAVPDHVTVLLDAHDPIQRGGTGRTIDWSLAATVARSRRVILSGGLTPENVAEAIARVRPYAVDVSSGVESKPGVKDPDKLRCFFEAVANLEPLNLKS